jgi:hypothetical protein
MCIIFFFDWKEIGRAQTFENTYGYDNIKRFFRMTYQVSLERK